MTAPGLQIEIVLALPERAIVKTLLLPRGASVADALALAALDADFAAVDFAASPVGVFGRLMPRDRPLADGDRVELYRPLAEDPKDARRARARQARKSRQ